MKLILRCCLGVVHKWRHTTLKFFCPFPPSLCVLLQIPLYYHHTILDPLHHKIVPSFIDDPLSLTTRKQISSIYKTPCEEEPFKPISYENIIIAFFILPIGITLGIVVLLMEIYKLKCWCVLTFRIVNCFITLFSFHESNITSLFD